MRYLQMIASSSGVKFVSWLKGDRKLFAHRRQIN